MAIKFCAEMQGSNIKFQSENKSCWDLGLFPQILITLKISQVSSNVENTVLYLVRWKKYGR